MTKTPPKKGDIYFSVVDKQVVEIEIMRVYRYEGKEYVLSLLKLEQPNNLFKITLWAPELEAFLDIPKVNKDYLGKIQEYFKRKEKLQEYRKSLNVSVMDDVQLARILDMKNTVFEEN